MRYRWSGSKHAVPMTRHGIRRSVCEGSDGLKDSRRPSDSSTASVMRLSSWAGRRAGGGDEGGRCWLCDSEAEAEAEAEVVVACRSPSCMELVREGWRVDGQLCVVFVVDREKGLTAPMSGEPAVAVPMAAAIEARRG